MWRPSGPTNMWFRVRGGDREAPWSMEHGTTTFLMGILDMIRAVA